MNNLEEAIHEVQSRIDFSGVVMVEDRNGDAANASFGYANRADHLENNLGTRFGIASGCKLFTAIAICQLVEEGKLTFDTRLKDCLDIEFPSFREEITIHHLLTHETLNKLLTPHVQEDEINFYGYGIWIKKQDDDIFKYHVTSWAMTQESASIPPTIQLLKPLQ